MIFSSKQNRCAKKSEIILFFIWPLVWAEAYKCYEYRANENTKDTKKNSKRQTYWRKREKKICLRAKNRITKQNVKKIFFMWRKKHMQSVSNSVFIVKIDSFFLWRYRTFVNYFGFFLCRLYEFVTCNLNSFIASNLIDKILFLCYEQRNKDNETVNRRIISNSTSPK